MVFSAPKIAPMPMITATREWVDIPIILWTAAPVKTQKEARVVHGADEVVQKEGGPAALVVTDSTGRTRAMIGVDPDETFLHLLNTRFGGQLKGPFNVPARTEAGFSRREMIAIGAA